MMGTCGCMHEIHCLANCQYSSFVNCGPLSLMILGILCLARTDFVLAMTILLQLEYNLCCPSKTDRHCHFPWSRWDWTGNYRLFAVRVARLWAGGTTGYFLVISSPIHGQNTTSLVCCFGVSMSMWLVWILFCIS